MDIIDEEYTVFGQADDKNEVDCSVFVVLKFGSFKRKVYFCNGLKGKRYVYLYC